MANGDGGAGPTFVIRWVEKACLWGLLIFLLTVSVISVRRYSVLFLRRHAVTHRAAGIGHFATIMLGVACLFVSQPVHHKLLWLLYDVLLGVFGVLATLTAAADFPHKHVKNAKGQSGTLSERAFVTQSEMIEHSFYQCLNLLQSVYLHAMDYLGKNSTRMESRLVLLCVVTSPWFVRNRFPIHSFSSNWKEEAAEREHTWIELWLYRIKKCQYIFYKHAILHGINVSVAVPASSSLHDTSGIPHTTSWRIFWIALNLSYVMEFFLQTMVKRRLISQQGMLALQWLLMTVSSLAAFDAVLGPLRMEVFVMSLLFNFYNRGHDVLNTMLVALTLMIVDSTVSSAELK
jgi:hypothetical protein